MGGGGCRITLVVSWVYYPVDSLNGIVGLCDRGANMVLLVKVDSSTKFGVEEDFELLHFLLAILCSCS